MTISSAERTQVSPKEAPLGKPGGVGRLVGTSVGTGTGVWVGVADGVNVGTLARVGIGMGVAERPHDMTRTTVRTSTTIISLEVDQALIFTSTNLLFARRRPAGHLFINTPRVATGSFVHSSSSSIRCSTCQIEKMW
jgi:hypothetical protein